MSLEEIRQEISSKNLGWEAGPTVVSELDEETRRGHLGLRISEDVLAANASAIRAVEAARSSSLSMQISAPVAVDWRNNNGNWVTSVKDQQACGSCVSFAVCGTVEARARIVCRNPTLDLDLSENQLFFCGCGNCCDTGWYFDQALNFAQNTGIALDADSPYTPVNQPCPPAQPRLRITSWKSVYSIAERKSSLASKGPMVAGMKVFSDFYNYRGGVYRHAAGRNEGGHAVVVVGYSDTDGCWICKNSWGTGFGESGFFRIAYGDASGMDTHFPFYEVEVSCPEVRPVVNCRDYVQLLQRVLVAARTQTSLRDVLRFYVCGRGVRRPLTRSQRTIVRNVLLILRQCPQYRAPFCRLLG